MGMAIAHFTGLESGQIKTLLNSLVDDVNDEVGGIAAGSGRGTLTRYAVVSLAGLDAISNATIGDVAYFTAAPATGINLLEATAHAGSGSGIDWRFEGVVIADTKAHLDSFVSAVAAVPDVSFMTGGLAYVTGTGLSYRWTGSAWARGELINLQLDTTNSTPTVITQYGIGKIIGNGTASISETVTFPVAFGSGITPVITMTAAGTRATGAFNPAGLSNTGLVHAGSNTASNTGFTAQLTAQTGATLGAANDFYYAWSATGAL